jgi:proteasome lid subunit RPN8/RPN11
VLHVWPTPNVRQSERRRGYLVDSAHLLAAMRFAHDHGLDVLGIYHSHPDHSARPSACDFEHAVAHWSTTIVSCRLGHATEIQSWRLRADGTGFDEEELVQA